MVRAHQQAVQEATSAENSAWVSAHAGSGKTYVLITRLVTLMLSGTRPEKLLCLTYTRTAAAEMKQRLNELLGEWAVLPDGKLKSEMKVLKYDVHAYSPPGARIAIELLKGKESDLIV